MRSDSLWPPVETPVLVQPQTYNSDLRHPRYLECDSRQAIKTSSSDPDGVISVTESVQSLYSRWEKFQIDLFATRSNNKLHRFVSPVLDWAAWAVDALSLQWENLDVYAFRPMSLLGKVLSKVMD